MNQFKRNRLLKEKTQFELFLVTGISPSRISLIERDLITPRPDERELLMRALLGDTEGIKDVLGID